MIILAAWFKGQVQWLLHEEICAKGATAAQNFDGGDVLENTTRCRELFSATLSVTGCHVFFGEQCF
jgi:hypothetical protein